jgi:glycosyltransferase involved in cell wall biosynthesis
MHYKTLSIIIPVYNEETFITPLLDRVVKSDTAGLFKEIIIIDDYSLDKTVDKVKTYIANKPSSNIFSLTLLQQSKNGGKGTALKKGFLASTGDIVIVQDGDLEYDPGEYTNLLEPFLKYDADVVYGSRFITNRPRRVLYFWHFMANIFLTALSNMFTNLNLSDMETGYKVFRGSVIRNIAPKLESERFGFEPEITARLAKIKGIKFYEVGISYWGRTYAEGKKIGWIDGIKAVWEIVKYNLLS